MSTDKLNSQRAQVEKALHFRSLHESGALPILPNAWDAVSAKIFEQEGFPAVGTTSAGIAAVHEHSDGEMIPLPTHLESITGIAASVDTPVSADIEAGYLSDVEGLAHTTRAVLACAERSPPIPELKALGVARLSFGPRPMRRMLGLLREMATEWKDPGPWESMMGSSPGYSDINGWFSRATDRSVGAERTHRVDSTGLKGRPIGSH